MYILLFGLWVVFNGNWTTEIALTGLAVAGLVYAFTCKFIGLSPRAEWRVIRKLPKVVGYAAFVVWEIVKANMQVLHFIYSPRMEVEPQLRSFRTKVKTDAGKVALANAITLTPGTITVNVKDDAFLVHCLDSSLAEGLEGSAFERKILEMEGDKA
ncbi:MAG: Na+/H+ antiporter subunit E [Clostridia bacterium]|nr:Na+/H+ antiporter subunit E [Clostridia bacterium]